MNFQRTSDGIYKEFKDGYRLICSPFEVVARTRDQSGQHWGCLLRWKDADGLQHEWAMPMEMFAKPQEAVLPLLSGGLSIIPGQHKAVLEYIQSVTTTTRKRCVNYTGWQGGAFVLPDAVIQAEGTEQVVYQVSTELRHNYKVRGTEEEWRTHIGRQCIGNRYLLLAVSCAFAGPIVRLLGEESGGLHFHGPTTSGKSTAAMVAGSVLGGGGREGFMDSWLSTANALEGAAALHNDTCLILDELSQVDPKQINDVIYMIAGGQGKGRMNSDILLRQKSTWAVTLISTGELTLKQHASAGGVKVRGGTTIRVLDILADAGKGMGVFENTHGSGSAAEFSNRLKEASCRYYGAPLRAWIEQLVRETEVYKSRLRQYIEAFEKKNRPIAASPEIYRAVHRFAVIAGAGELATELGITGWRKGDAAGACAQVLTSWILLRGGGGSHDDEQMVRQVRHFLQLHGDSRFLPFPTRRLKPLSGRKLLVQNCAGYHKGDRYFFHTEVFRDDVCKDYDHLQVCRVLKDRGYLDHAPKRYEKQARVGKEPAHWFYVVKASILESDVTSNQQTPEPVVTAKPLKEKPVTAVIDVTFENVK